MQQRLREQIAINNERRVKLIGLVKPKMREHEEVTLFVEKGLFVYSLYQARKQKLVNQQIEKNLTKLLQRKKKRGGRRSAPPQVGSA